MTLEQLEKLEQLAKSATPGPWEYDDTMEDIHSVYSSDLNIMLSTSACTKATAKFIAAANPTTIRVLIATIKELMVK